MQTQQEFEQKLQNNIRIVHMERNQHLRDYRQRQIELAQQLSAQGIAEALQQLWCDYIDSYESNIPLEEQHLGLSARLRALADYYRLHPEQRAAMQRIFRQLEKIDQAYGFASSVGRGVSTLKTACDGIDQFDLLQKLLQREQPRIPAAALSALQQLTQASCYFHTDSKGSYAELRKLAGAKLDAMPDAEAAGLLYWVMQALVEIQPKNLPSHEAPHSFSTVLEKMLAALLGAAVANEHAALAEAAVFMSLTEHFHVLLRAIHDRKLIQLMAKLTAQKGKKKQLTPEMQSLLLKLDFICLNLMGYFPAKQLEKYQQKIVETVGIAQQEQAAALSPAGAAHPAETAYALPFSETEAAVGAFIQQGRQKLAWVAQLQREFDALPAGEKHQWMQFWQHIDSQKAGKPSKKWLTEAEKIWKNSAVGENYLAQLQHWLGVIQKASPRDTRPFDTKNENTLRGVLWFSQFQQHQQAELLSLLSGFSQFCWRKIEGVGAASAVIGGVCLNLLAQRGLAGLAKLSFLQRKIRYELGQKQIRKALNEAAQANGLSADEIKETVAEDFGFAAGQSAAALWGDCQLSLHCSGDKRCSVRVQDAQQRSIDVLPKGMQSSGIFKELKKQAFAVEKQLHVYAQNFEENMLQERQWPYAFWREYVIAHGLLGWMASRMIWQLHLSNGAVHAAVYHNQAWQDAQQQVLDVDAVQIEKVSLWHPVFSAPAAVQAWRGFFMAQKIQQPFKQAFREVYAVNETEAAGAQSLRFAYHYLQQPKFKAVAHARGWHYDIQGGWDNFSMPSRHFSRQKILAALRIGLPEGHDLMGASGVYLYIKTQEIVFKAEQGAELNLAEVPKLVFSEAMRDIDYFIQGCSIGMDLALELTGFPDEMRNYYASGGRQSNSQIWANRHYSLDAVLSQLDIAAQCRLDQHFVYVTGKLHEYKIHIGTGHSFMSPNDQFLCIVPERKIQAVHAAHLFLPFDDDAMLSLILSKVLLLSQDDQIQDALIQKQIKVA